MSKLAFLYGAFLLGILVMILLSKDSELPPGMDETGISRAFLKVSLLIYRQLRDRIRGRSSEKVRVYLRTLEQRKDIENAETEYFIRKISIVLIMAFAGSFLALMVSLGAGRTSHISDGRVIPKGEFGDRDFEVMLVAKDGAGNEIGEFDMPVAVRVYTEAEADALFDRACSELEQRILGGNPGLDRVTTDLNLVEKLEGYPFDIRWKADNYEVMGLEGKLKQENIPEEGVTVMLTATFRYEEYSWQQVLYAFVLPPELSPGQRAVKEIRELLEEADEEAKTENAIELPKDYDGQELIWSEKSSDNSLILLMLTLIGGVASYILKDKELKKAMEDRRTQMLGDYSQMVSQLVLYMEAGMTMRNIFGKLANSYMREKKSGAPDRYLYEEILMTWRELSAGTSEAAAYEHFGIRCGGQQYARLCTLLTQNLKKGNAQLLTLLRDESKSAFLDRMDRARKAGEEAGTKLLLPMMIMLVIVMVIIMIPAYMAF